MVQKSKGPRRRTRTLFRKKARERTSITKSLQEFKLGEKVLIKLESSAPKGRPFKRFYGKVGMVTKKRGKSYIIKIKDGNKEKEIISSPIHLRLV